MSTFNLNEARRLHDRDPDNPTACATCAGAPHPEYETPQMAPWPCHTARALGATGNSEWTGPDDIAGRGIWTIPKIIHFDSDTPDVCGHRDPNSTATCNRTHGHNGPHTASTRTIGDGITQWSTDPCPIDSTNIPGGKWCILNREHLGPCYFANKGEQIYRCTTTGGARESLACALRAGHPTDRPHVNINGSEWNTSD